MAAFAIDKGAPGFDGAGHGYCPAHGATGGASLATTFKDVHLLAGLLWLDAEIEEADGTLSAVVGQPQWRASLDAQWTVNDRLSVDTGLNYDGETPARRDGTAMLQARLFASVGANLRIGKSEAAPHLRVSIDNKFDANGWSVSDDESLYAIEPRTFRIGLTFVQ